MNAIAPNPVITSSSTTATMTVAADGDDLRAGDTGQLSSRTPRTVVMYHPADWARTDGPGGTGHPSAYCGFPM